MTIARLAGIGAIFAGSVLAGFGLGLVVANHTGNSEWAIVGFFAGLLLGGCVAALELSRVLRS
ncbi:MAG: hypothetical protein GIW98_00700 [Candidatus Eremiobacteraeota bacterium]|nr:hypothetical protein [Candidatus Eremiobacteraeota bacterium]